MSKQEYKEEDDDYDLIPEGYISDEGKTCNATSQFGEKHKNYVMKIFPNNVKNLDLSKFGSLIVKDYTSNPKFYFKLPDSISIDEKNDYHIPFATGLSAKVSDIEFIGSKAISTYDGLVKTTRPIGIIPSIIHEVLCVNKVTAINSHLKVKLSPALMLKKVSLENSSITIQLNGVKIEECEVTSNAPEEMKIVIKDRDTTSTISVNELYDFSPLLDGFNLETTEITISGKSAE